MDSLRGSPAVQIKDDECCRRVCSGQGLVDSLALQQPHAIRPVSNVFGDRGIIQTDVMLSFRTSKAACVSLGRGALVDEGCNRKGITNNTLHSVEKMHVQGTNSNGQPSSSTLKLEHPKLDHLSTKLDQLIKHFLFHTPHVEVTITVFFPPCILTYLPVFSVLNI